MHPSMGNLLWPISKTRVIYIFNNKVMHVIITIDINILMLFISTFYLDRLRMVLTMCLWFSSPHINFMIV